MGLPSGKGFLINRGKEKERTMEKFYVAKQLSKDDDTMVSSELTEQQAVLMKCRSARFSVHVDGENAATGNGENVTRFLHLISSKKGWEVKGLMALDADGKIRASIHAQRD